MRSGQLRNKVEIWYPKPGSTSDAFGDKVKANDLYAESFAFIKPLSARELEKAKQIQAETTHQIIIRFIAGIESNMMIKWGSREFEILGPPINTEERNYELAIMAKEIHGG